MKPANTTDQEVLEMLAAPAMDEMILWVTKLTRPQLIRKIQFLWATGQITPEIEARAISYQLKKHKPKP
jgi:hypothetical protein